MAWDSSNCLLSYNFAAWGRGNGKVDAVSGYMPNIGSSAYRGVITRGATNYGYLANSRLYKAATNGKILPITSPWNSSSAFTL
jgi:hypothetical protein